MHETDRLAEWRMHAAEVSRGISDQAIYAAIEKIVMERDLRGAVLDYGAGVGHLTRRILGLNRFESVTCIDLVNCAADLMDQVRWIQQDLNQPLSNGAHEFDVVIAAEIIEHLENPRSTMRDLFRVLKPGGSAIVTTPNNESLRSLLALFMRGHYVAFGDTCYPAHITALLRKDLERIFAESGFKEVQFHFSGHGSIPLRPSLTWQRVGLSRLRGVRFCDNILAIAKKPT